MSTSTKLWLFSKHDLERLRCKRIGTQRIDDMCPKHFLVFFLEHYARPKDCFGKPIDHEL
jgi:hypothetical protein